MEPFLLTLIAVLLGATYPLFTRFAARYKPSQQPLAGEEAAIDRAHRILSDN